MERQYDLVVVGTGITSAVASRCREAGWTVAVLDSRPFGGTCALRGCVPKKILVSAAEAVHGARDMAGKGVPAGSLTIDWPELMRFKRALVDPTPAHTEQAWAKMGIEQFHGRARFVGPATLAVGPDRLTGRRVLIAAGAMPAPLKFPGAERLTTSDQFLNLDRLPDSLAFIGGGYISFEFAHVAARAGARVTVLHRGARPLEGFDADLVKQLVHATNDIGADVRLKTVVEAVKKEGDRLVVQSSTNEGNQDHAGDLVVHGAGRVPEIDDLDLGKAGVTREEKGVSVNEFLQSVSNPAVYAAGDAAATGGLRLTPVASMEGHIAASNMLKGNHRKPNYSGVPTVVFTVPPLASAGLQEDEARKQGLKFKVKHEDTSGWYSSRRVNLKHSGFKVLVEEDSNRILGAHLLGEHAEEVINLFALAIRFGLKADDLKAMIYAYPTSASDVSYMV